MTEKTKIKLSLAMLFLPSILFSQLRIQPNVGLNFNRNQREYSNPNLSGFQNIPSFNFGLSLNYKTQFYQYELGFNHASVGTGSYSHLSYSGLGFITPQFQYQFLIYKKVKEFELFRKYQDRKAGVPYTISKPKKKFYLLVFDLYPFLGYSLNQAKIKNKYFNTRIEDDYYYYPYLDDTRLSRDIEINHTFGHSLIFGVKFQFKNKSKDLVALSAQYNIGLTKLITTHFQHLDQSTNDFTLNSYFSTRGTYWGFQLAFPINLTKPKVYYPKRKR